uniref:Uncharacterized protein n=1 Tax=Oryza meridionalis TaxID=40149 RepID=A0A0E0EMB1_9ORYZ
MVGTGGGGGGERNGQMARWWTKARISSVPVAGAVEVIISKHPVRDSGGLHMGRWLHHGLVSPSPRSPSKPKLKNI